MIPLSSTCVWKIGPFHKCWLLAPSEDSRFQLHSPGSILSYQRARRIIWAPAEPVAAEQEGSKSKLAALAVFINESGLNPIENCGPPCKLLAPTINSNNPIWLKKKVPRALLAQSSWVRKSGPYRIFPLYSLMPWQITAYFVLWPKYMVSFFIMYWHFPKNPSKFLWQISFLWKRKPTPNWPKALSRESSGPAGL